MSRRVAVFLAGLPGSGKTRIVQSLFSGATVLDLDAEMRRHKRFDPANPALIYEEQGVYDWADALIERKFQTAIRDTSVVELVLDGTGTKMQRRERRVKAAKAHAMTTMLLYVKVTLDTALRRNAQRQRIVPPNRLEEYQALIDAAVDAERHLVDRFHVVDNDIDVPLGMTLAMPDIRTSRMSLATPPTRL